MAGQTSKRLQETCLETEHTGEGVQRGALGDKQMAEAVQGVNLGAGWTSKTEEDIAPGWE